MKREFDLATYELIDKYLLQELSDQEKNDFEDKARARENRRLRSYIKYKMKQMTSKIK